MRERGSQSFCPCVTTLNMKHPLPFLTLKISVNCITYLNSNIFFRLKKLFVIRFLRLSPLLIILTVIWRWNILLELFYFSLHHFQTYPAFLKNVITSDRRDENLSSTSSSQLCQVSLSISFCSVIILFMSGKKDHLQRLWQELLVNTINSV